MNAFQEIKAIICGCFQSETIINLENQVFYNLPGGSLTYAATGFRFWENNPALVSRISHDTPHDIFNQFLNRGINTQGIFRNSSSHEMRAFYKVLNPEKIDSENPMKYFAAIKQPLPKYLLGYSGLPFLSEKKNIPSPITLFPEHIPKTFLDGSFALLCAIDFSSLSILPPFLRMNGIENIIIKPSKGSMISNFWNDIPNLVRGCAGLICTSKEAASLYLGKSENLMEIIESISNFGLEFVVVTCGKNGQHLYMKNSRTHWLIPAYPAKVIDPVHASDTFSGAFLAGFLKYMDPLWACLYGNIATSIKLEGSGAFYLLDALPELANARLEILRREVKKI